MKKIIKEIIKYIFPEYDISKKIYRLYQKMHKARQQGNLFLANRYNHKIYKKYNCIISPTSIIGKNIKIPHPIGIVIGEGVIIGDNVTIYQNVTLGRKHKDTAEYPIIEDNVTIYANTIIVGKIRVGNNAVIGCNSFVNQSIEENKVVIGNPAKIIKKENI